MEHLNELKAKARELEHADQPEAALAVYLQLAERSDDPAPVVWARAGDLQLRLGQAAQAKKSLGRAAAEFADAGQLNNAIAVSRRLIEARLDTPEVHLRLGELALTQRYPQFARESIASFARSMVADRRIDESVSPIAAYLQRFPDERTLWRDWVDEILATGTADDARQALTRLAEALTESGATKPAQAIQAEVRKLGPDPVPEASDEDVGRTELDDDEDLPLLGLQTDFADSRAASDTEPAQGSAAELEPLVDSFGDEAVVAPLEGLQPTHEEWDNSDRSEEPVEPLPLLDPSPQVDTAGPDEPHPPAARSETFEEAGTEAEPDPLVADTGAGALEWSDVEVEPSSRPDDSTRSSLNLGGAVAELLRLTSRGVEAAEDPSTHYDLGVAFKEMGLTDESIAHLAMALERGHDPIATLEVLGEILVSRGKYELVVRLLQPVLAAGGESRDLLGIHYWLGRSFEELRRPEDARSHYQRVLATDPGFRDVSVRVDRLESSF